MVVKVILKTNNHGFEKIKDPILVYNHDLQFFLKPNNWM
jgi:hypothetical protein